MDETITTKQCRDLRMVTDAFTAEPALTLDEFSAIMLIFSMAKKRIEQEEKTQHD